MLGPFGPKHGKTHFPLGAKQLCMFCFFSPFAFGTRGSIPKASFHLEASPGLKALWHQKAVPEMAVAVKNRVTPKRVAPKGKWQRGLKPVVFVGALILTTIPKWHFLAARSSLCCAGQKIRTVLPVFCSQVHVRHSCVWQFAAYMNSHAPVTSTSLVPFTRQTRHFLFSQKASEGFETSQ